MREEVITTDSDLVTMLRAGDQTAFNEIYNRYWKPLYHSAYKILQDEDGASDALQEIFTSLWQRRNAVEITSLKAYLHQAARFTVLKAIRAQKTDQQFYKRLAEVTTEIFTENPLVFKEQQHLIQHLLERLPEDCKEIFLMSREENLTYKQIAEILQISEKTVEKKMTKSLKMIREGLSVEFCLSVIFYYSISGF